MSYETFINPRVFFNCRLDFTLGFTQSFLSFFTYLNSGNNEEPASKRRRICRMGAGIEVEYKSCKTPGFNIRDKADLVQDNRGYTKLELPRDHPRTVQSSVILLQGWRANCDIQILLYESDPMNPDPVDVAKVTDYIVGYACKGNETLKEEKEQISSLILNAKDIHGCNKDVKRLARQILNKAGSKRVISKQEAMVHIANLELFSSSESIETVSISGEYNLQTGRSNTFLCKYANRCEEFWDLSLHEYFLKVKRNKGNKPIIPHYVGGRSQPVYPPTQQYCKSIMVIFKPWHGRFHHEEDRNYITEFADFLLLPSCPNSVKVPYERIRTRVLEKTQFVEPTATGVDYDQYTKQADDKLKEFVSLVNTLNINPENLENLLENEYDMGKEYDCVLIRTV